MTSGNHKQGSTSMASFLEQHDLTYSSVIARWLDGIPMANGDIGAVLWGDGSPLKITLDKYDVWELRRSAIYQDNRQYSYGVLRELVAKREFLEAAKLLSASRLTQPEYPKQTSLPLPRFEIDLNGGVKSFSARLSLHDARASGQLESAGGPIDWMAYIHSERNLVIIRLGGQGISEACDVALSMNDLAPETAAALEKWGYPAPLQERTRTSGSFWQAFPGDGGYAAVWRRLIRESEEWIFLAIATHNDAAEPRAHATSIVESAAESDQEELFREHAAFWHDYWERSFVALPDSLVENFLYLELYKMACSSRPGKYAWRCAALWSPDGEFPREAAGQMHTNLNAQEAYWPIFASNHLELGEPFYEFFCKHLPLLRKKCNDFCEVEGIWVATAMIVDGTSNEAAGWTCQYPLSNGPWIAHHFWLHWLYSRDRTFLREQAYPFMRACMQTYLNLLERWDDQRYHLPLSNSPEYGQSTGDAWGADTNIDLQLIRWLGHSLIEAVKILRIDDQDEERWKDVLANLAPYPQGPDGLHIYAGQPLEHSHRHFSHLLAIHPLGTLNIEGPDEDRELIERSLEHLRQKGAGEWISESFPWASLIYARTGNRHLAWQLLQAYLCREFAKGQNLHQWTNASFAGAAAVLEMLLQSWGGKIRVFPSIPDLWNDLYFRDLRAEGAFLVTAKMRERNVLFIEILSEAGESCSVINPFPGEARLTDCHSGKTRRLKGHTLTFNTAKGDRFRLSSCAKELDREDLSPIADLRSGNWFGEKRSRRLFVGLSPEGEEELGAGASVTYSRRSGD